MKIRSLNHGDVLKLLPDRPVNGHKGDFGKILLCPAVSDIPVHRSWLLWELCVPVPGWYFWESRREFTKLQP